ncbi:MAG: response regulator [Salinivirgaceae bacterium]|nr:response regulator [Salinivirgaceae bacterium]
MQNPKILIVDDEMVHLDAIIDVLENEVCNYGVFSAFNGKTALEIAKKEMPNLIISDWEMPEMNGIELIKHLKSETKTANIPIIMSTGVMLTSEHLKIALEAGAIDFIRKPIDEVELLARVNSAILLFEEMRKNFELETELLRKNKEQAELEVIENKQALAKLTLRIIQNNELNDRLFDELNQIVPNCNEKGKKAVSRVISSFKTDSKNINWQEFDLLFEQVHHNFYENLNKHFSDLSLNERKLCVFYKLNLNSKEICSLTLQSENTLKKARARLRKKLNLSANESLHQFLQQFV